jgi:hypothetical protein
VRFEGRLVLKRLNGDGRGDREAAFLVSVWARARTHGEGGMEGEREMGEGTLARCLPARSADWALHAAQLNTAPADAWLRKHVPRCHGVRSHVDGSRWLEMDNLTAGFG